MTALLVVLLIVTFIGVAQREAPERRLPPQARADVPDLRNVQAVPERKQRFFGFLRPVVVAENERLRARRERVLQALRVLEAGVPLARSERRWLDEMARRYRVEVREPLSQARGLARKVDTIPVSLALAQAAMESGWGTSRFAREANNLFGEWCFSPGCGLVPERRPAKATYEVEVFADAGAAVRSYMLNLNSHPAHEPLRAIRARARAAGRTPTGSALAAGLINYAEIGQRYVEHIRGVIRRNGLDEATQG